MLITDCGSFLSEYLPTKSPVFHLISEDPVPHHPFHNRSARSYYKIHTVDELENMFKTVILEKNDSMREERLKDLESLSFGNATDNIMEELEKLL